VKLDRLMKQQVAAQQEHVKHLMEMKTMFEEQHNERMTVIKGLVKEIRRKKTKKARQTLHPAAKPLRMSTGCLMLMDLQLCNSK